MARLARASGLLSLLLAVALPVALAGQAGHRHDDPAEHSHAGGPVDCATLAAPPWTGLPDGDRARVQALHHRLAELSTPEAARAAGFRPALGDIPGMGIHYVHPQRTRDGVDPDAVDHLLFAEIDGREQLVGAAYAFRDVPDTDVPLPFESDLAHWHDHPEFAPEGQTLHMLHVWFIPSSNGPFAGLNFWLPFRTAGVEPPSACWMANPDDMELIQLVSFALAPRAWGDGGARVVEPVADRAELLGALDAAAKTGDREAWLEAAERFVADLTPEELEATRRQLRSLTQAQMSSSERGG